MCSGGVQKHAPLMALFGYSVLSKGFLGFFKISPISSEQWTPHGSIYEQKENADMENAVFGVIANLYMESFEEQTISPSSYKPRI